MNKTLHDIAIENSAHQAGVLTRSQLLECGFTDNTIGRYVETRRFDKLFRGVYSTVTGEPSRESLLWAAHLRCGPESFIYGPTALELWGFRSIDTDVWVAIPHSVRRIPGPQLRVVRVNASRKIKLRGELPIEAPADALLDSTVQEKDSEKVQNRIVDAVQQRIVKTGDLADAIASRRIPHRKIFEESLDLLRGGKTTRLEINANRDVLQAHGLPEGQWQVKLNFGGSTQVVDLFFPEFRLIVEFDGLRGHSTSAGRFRDMERDNRALLVGLPTLRFGWNDVRYRKCQMAKQIAGVLAERGWQARPTPCKDRLCDVS